VAYNEVFEAAGGIELCKSMSEEPRNKSQVYNACKSVKSETVPEKDEIFDLLALLKARVRVISALVATTQETLCF